MIRVKLGTVALCSLLVFAACAHQNLNPVSKSQGSLSWPLPMPENIVHIDIPKHLMAAVESPRPKPIAIPRAKAYNQINDPSFETPLVFDIPVAYNSQVKFWIEYFQTSG